MDRGAFEGIRCYATQKGPVIFRLGEHIDRLLHSFSSFGVAVPWNKEELEQAARETVEANQLSNCYLRPLLFFGAESILLSPRKLSVHCAIIALPLEKYLGNEPVTVALSSIPRINVGRQLIENKINGFYVNSIFAFNQAQERGFDEALLLDHEGAIAEGSVANIFFVIEGVLTTPLTGSILPGITRSSILELAAHLGIRVEERVLKLDALEKATEGFFTGTASEITPIKLIESTYFTNSPGPITQKLQKAYHEVVTGGHKKFESWLTFI